MLFLYQAIDQSGATTSGSIDAMNSDVAISSLQKRGLIIKSIISSEEASGVLKKQFHIFNPVKNKDIVILSRQIATLFAAQVSALRVFRLLSSESDNRALGKILAEVSDDIQSGASISKALSKHDKVFSDFYVNMVRAGEESGKLEEIFN
jgi:type IV pilus assembly protein PilC